MTTVATDCDQEYLREVVVGDRLTWSETIIGISEEKQTALGAGHFMSTEATGNQCPASWSVGFSTVAFVSGLRPEWSKRWCRPIL